MRLILNMDENDNRPGETVTTTSLDREIDRRLKEHDARYTRGRRLVVATLAGSDGPRSAAELQASIGSSLPLSSLYRSLAVLETAGVVVPHFGKKGVTRYELAEWLQGHHHHLVCLDCGAVEDLALPQSYEEKVRELVEEIGSTALFTPVNHAFEIEGVCSRCA
jgi:Fur family transcriptional regulator, ferric uptake regulator